MNRRTYLNAIISTGFFTATAGCISRNSVNYEFEIISLYEDISELDIPEERDKLPHIRKDKNNIIIEGSVAHGSCSEPYVNDVYLNENEMNVTVSTRSTKNILDKIINPSCTLAQPISGFRITIPIQNKDIKSVNISIEHSNEDIDKTEVL